MNYPLSLQSVIDELGRLPGVGPKSATRMAFWLMRQDRHDVERLAQSILHMAETLTLCDVCFNVTDDAGSCRMCSDDRRDRSIICVVEDTPALGAVEATGAFHGQYHVLGGLLDPLSGVTLESLKIRELLQRVKSSEVKEVILCLSPTVEGEATELQLARLLDVPNLVVSQPAAGLPVGGDVEFADAVTLARAVEGRLTLNN